MRCIGGLPEVRGTWRENNDGGVAVVIIWNILRQLYHLDGIQYTVALIYYK